MKAEDGEGRKWDGRRRINKYQGQETNATSQAGDGILVCTFTRKR